MPYQGLKNYFDTLSGSKYFTVFDMKLGYHQIEVFKEHKCRTAFTVGPLGFGEFNHLPFGLRQTACLVVNPIIVDGYASLFNCTTAVRASDSMTASS